MSGLVDSGTPCIKFVSTLLIGDSGGSAVYSMVLRPLACWECGFEFLCWHGLLSLGTVVFCQVEFSTLGRSLYQRSSIDCGVSECDREDSILRRLWPTGGFYATREENTLLITLRLYLNDCR